MEEDQPPDFNEMLQVVWIKEEAHDDVADKDNVNESNDDDDNDNDEDYLVPITRSRQNKSTTTVKSAKEKKKIRKKPEATLSCQYCDYKTAYKQSLIFHLYNHSSNVKPFACELCSYATKYPTSLQRHIIGQHKAKDDPSITIPTYSCKDCPYKSIFKSNLAAHRRKHSEEKQFKCELCEFSTAYKNNFVKHNRVHHPKEEKIYRCDKCPFVAKAEGFIFRHKAQKHNEVADKVNRCENCNFITKLRWRLNIHRKRSHQESPIKCEYCDLSFVFMCEYKFHRSVHRKPLKLPHENSAETNQFRPRNTNSGEKVEKPPSMKIAGEIEWKNIQVQELPGQEKSFKCILCDYTSKFKASVQRHFQRHHTESHIRPYKCANCDFSTKTQDQMALHNKRSKVDTLLHCTVSVCEFTTQFKCQLVYHQKIHNPFKCPLCDYSCRHKYYVQKHCATTHQIDWSSFDSNNLQATISENNDSSAPDDSLLESPILECHETPIGNTSLENPIQNRNELSSPKDTFLQGSVQGQYDMSCPKNTWLERPSLDRHEVSDPNDTLRQNSILDRHETSATGKFMSEGPILDRQFSAPSDTLRQSANTDRHEMSTPDNTIERNIFDPRQFAASSDPLRQSIEMSAAKSIMERPILDPRQYSAANALLHGPILQRHDLLAHKNSWLDRPIFDREISAPERGLGNPSLERHSTQHFDLRSNQGNQTV